MSVNNITTKTDDSAIVVLVHLALAKPGTSGSFAYRTLPLAKILQALGASIDPANWPW
jgi:hypothetical protein